ncbi:TPA: hypothetical protein I7241_03360 [Vibrio vulnificus]|nr:hypothetical protein [Vibrio vulnificus]
MLPLLFRFMLRMSILAALSCSSIAMAETWSVIGQLTGNESPLSQTAADHDSAGYRCEQNEHQIIYCYDSVRYYQITFFAEIEFHSSITKIKLGAPYKSIIWSQLQLNLRKDRMQMAEASSSGQSFYVQTLLAKATNQEEVNLVDRNLILFLNQHRLHPQQQRWLPVSQYYLEQTDVLVELSHDMEWITLEITLLLP